MTTGSTKQYIGVIDMLCEGPIQGLVDGSKTSVYVNDIPFETSEVVGSLTNSTDSIFGLATLDASGTNVTDVQGFTVKESDIGKFIIVDVKSCPVTVSFTSTEYGIFVNLTGTSDDNKLTEDYSTSTSNTTFVRITSSSGFSLERDITVSSGSADEGVGNGYALIDMRATPTGQQWSSTEDYTATLVSAVKIATVDEENNEFTVESAISSSDLNNAKFVIQDARAEDSDSPTANSQSIISKIDGSTVQFRNGELYQGPVTPVHSLSGGVSIAGGGNATELFQSNDGDIDLNNNYGFTSYDIGGYPIGQSFDKNSGPALVIPSSGGTGPNFNLTTAQRSQVDEVNIRINYPTLITYDNTNGDKSSASAIYVFQIAVNKEGSWSSYKTLFSQYGGKIVHTAKTTAPVSFGHTIGLTRFKPFDDFRIRILRLTRPAGLPVWSNGSNGGKTNKDDWSCQAASQVGGADLTSTIKDNLSYPYTAHAGVSFSSKSYSSLPTRSYLLQGKKVRIPSSYTPREYTEDGIAKYDTYWDGTFKKNPDTNRHLLYYTDNPAWVFYDILTNDRYGVGKWIDKDIINKFSLYRISKYCDELVDDGTKYSGGSTLTVGKTYKIKEVGTTSWTSLGAASNTVGVTFIATGTAVTGTGVVSGQEPRFRANLFFTRPTEVYKVLKDMATVFLGMLYWLDGKVTPVQDVPGEPVYTFSKSNVINGVFNYESTGRQTRPNQIVVTWNDPKVNYEQVPLIVEDRNDIVARGRIISENAVAMGATSEGQALRYGRWKLWTAQNQTEIVSFETGLQGAYLRPGDIINIQDRDRYGVDFSGLVKSFNSSSSAVTFDRAVTNLSNANTWELNTVVTNFAAFYTGVDPLHIDNSTGYKVFAPGAGITTFNKGDRFTSTFWYPDATPDSGSTIDLDDIPSFYSGSTDLYDSNVTDAEKLVSNAHVLFAETGGPLGNTGLNTGSGYNYEPLPLDWKEHTYVVKKAGTLNNDKNVFTPTVVYDANERPTAGSVWALYSEDAVGRNILGTTKQYRVVGIAQSDEKNTYGLSAVEHYNIKYDAVDKDYSLGATPENVFPTTENTDEDVPAPENIYVVLKTDSTKRGEEFDIEWTTPQESYTISPGVTGTRDYSFFSEYEVSHNVPEMPSPLRTTRNSISFTGVPDGQYVFRVRTVSRKQNYSRYTSTEYAVDDPFATDIPRVVGGLPKGLIANSTFYKVAGSDSLDYDSLYRLEWESSTPIGHSIGSEFTLSSANTAAISVSLNDVPLYGLVNNGFPRAEYSPGTYPADRGVDGTKPDSTWHYLLFDGGNCTLAHWNTTSLDGLPFMQKIPELGDAEIPSIQWISISGYRGASQTWDELNNASLAKGSNKLVGSSNLSLNLRDIVHFAGRDIDFAHYKLDNISILSSKQTAEVDIRAYFEEEGPGTASTNINIKNTLNWRNGDIVSFERVEYGNAGDLSPLNGNYYYVNVDYHNGLNPSQFNLCLLYKTYEAAVNPASVEETAGSFIVDEEYTIISVGTTTTWADVGVSGTATVGSTFTASAAGSGNGKAILSKHLVSSSDIGGTFTSYTGYIFPSKVKAAKVTAIIDSTTVLLDRSFDEDISSRPIYKLNYRPGYNNDAVFGRVKWSGYDNSASAHQFILDKFITVDPGLVVEGLQVLVTPSTSVLQYNADGTTQTTNVNGDITARIDAIGFKNPQFRIVEVEGGGNGVDRSDYTATWNNPTNTGGFFYSEVIATGANPNESDNIPFEEAEPLVITAEVRESKAIDINAFGTGQITKVTSGSDGLDGKTVHLTSEDYSIIYDESGANPSLNGADTTITLTAEAFNFTNPQFKWTLIEDFADDSAFTTSDSTQNGYTWGTFKENDSGTGNDFISTATIALPSTYLGNWNNTKLQKQFTVKVEVAEEDDPTTVVEAFDEVSIIGVHAGNGGKWVILSNPSHTVVTDGAGSIDAAYDSNTNAAGFATAENSGTTIEVGRGDKILSPYTVTVNGVTSQGSETDWNDLSYDEKENKYFIKYTENSDGYFNKGAVSFNGNLTVLGDHEFSINGWTANTASLGIQVYPEVDTTSSSGVINIAQGFSKSKKGFGGIAVINSNSFESLPVDKNNNVLVNSSFDAYTLTATTINVFMGGVNLPYYGTSTAEATALDTDKPAAYWQYTQNDSGVNITPAAENTYTYPSSGDRYAALSIPAASAMPKADNTASITWTLTVYIRNDNNTYSSETVTTTQRIVKNKNSANISAYSTIGHYIFDGDNLSAESPATSYSINWNTTLPEGANEYVTLEGGPLTSATKQTSSPYSASAPNYKDTNGDLNYPIVFTAKLYNFDDGGDPSSVPTSDDLLDVDTVTISASVSAVDDVVMELDNDNETVGGSTGEDIGDGSTTVVTTTATIFTNGNDDTSNWQFSIPTLPSTLTGSLSGTNNDGPTLNITEIDKTFTSAQITITATRTGYTQHQKVFTLTRVNDQATFKILSDHSAVTYNPNSSAYNPLDATVDFSFVKIENGQSSEFTGRYDIDDSGTLTSGSSATHTFEATSATSVNVKLYNASGTATLLDEETVPLIIGGEDGDSAKALSISPDHQFFARQKDNTTYAPTAIKFTANKQNITGTVSWSGTIQPAGTSITFYTDAAGTTSTSTGNTVYILDDDVTSTTSSVVVTATLGAYSDTESVEVIDVGSDGIVVSLSNDNHTFPAELNGTVLNANRGGSGTNIAVYEGNYKLTGTTVATQAALSAGQFRVVGTPTPSTNGPTIGSGPTISSGEIVYQNAVVTNFTASTGTITFNIEGKTRKGDVFTTSKVQSFSKALQGAGGSDSKVVQLTAADYSIVYDANGLNPSPSSTITLTATASNFTDPYFKFTGDMVSPSTPEGSYTDGTDDEDTFSWTVPATYFSTPQTVRVGVSEAADATEEIAFDTITLTGIKPGSSELSMVVSGGASIDSTGTKISKSGAGGWNAQVYSGTGFRAGIKVEYEIEQTNKAIMLGINGDPATNASFNSLDYALYHTSGASLRAYESGTSVQTFGSYAAGDNFKITYDNEYVRYYKNGTLLRSVLTTADRLFHFDSSINSNGTDQATELSIKPYTPGADAYTVVCTNESHAFPANNSGEVSDYTGSGTTFEAYRGTTRLQGITTGTPTGGEFKVTAGTAVNIDKSSTNGSVSGFDIEFGVHSEFADNESTASIPYSISLENKATISKTQTFSKAKQGEDSPVIVQVFLLNNSATAPDAPDGTTTYDFSNGAIGLSTQAVTDGWSTSRSSTTSSNKYLWAAEKKVSFPASGTSVNILEADWSVTLDRNFSEGANGAPGPKIYSGYLYYQGTSASPGPNAPSNSGVSMTFSTGVLSGGVIGTGSTNWNQNPPTFIAGNSNKYWYVYYTAQETGTFANGVYPTQSVTFGSTVYQGMGFSGLVTFASDGDLEVAGTSQTYDPAARINNNTTTINGGKITTGTIAAEKLTFYDSTNSRINVSSFWNDEDYQDSNQVSSAISTSLSGYLTTTAANNTYLTIATATSTYQVAGNYLTTSTTGANLTNFSGIATAAGIAYEADLYDPSNASGGIDATFKSALTAAGLSLDTDFFDANGNINSTFSANLTSAGLFLSSSLDANSDSGLSVVNNKLKLTSSSLTIAKAQAGLGNVENKNEADQLKGAFSQSTAITAGSINLKSGSAGIDISAVNQRITITDSNGTVRVKLGQL